MELDKIVRKAGDLYHSLQEEQNKRAREKAGICENYLPGPLESRKGTTSCFCRNCGKPGGYHRTQ